MNLISEEHPKYEHWKMEAEKFSNDEDTIALYVFMQASTWPDEIRCSGNPFDHLGWHFVDYPFVPPDRATKPKSPGVRARTHRSRVDAKKQT